MSLPRFYVPQLDAASGAISLNPEEARHAVVRRLGRGDAVRLFNGLGLERPGRIASLGKGKLIVEPAGPPIETPRPVHRNIVALGLVKWDRFRLAVEKAVELGVTDIWPVKAELSQNIHRQVAAKSTKVAIEAMKQSGRSRLPDITEPMPLAEAVEKALDPASPMARKLVGQAGAPPFLRAVPAGEAAPGRIVFLIGPEGGLTDREMDLALGAGFEPVSLSDAILRTETAVLAAATIMGQLNRG